MFGSGFQKVLVVSFFLLSFTAEPFEPQPPTRCLDANDGWHDGANGGGYDGFYCSCPSLSVSNKHILYAIEYVQVNSRSW